MKKLVSILITVSLVFSILPAMFTTTVYAAELLTNTGFEDSDISMWNANGCSIARTNTEANTGSYSLQVTQRTNYYASPRQNITSLLNTSGQGIYNFSTYLKLLSGEAAASMYVVVNVTSSDSGSKWYTGAVATVTDSAFSQSLATNKLIIWDGTVTSAYIYVQNVSSSVTSGFYADDFAMEKSTYVYTEQTAELRNDGSPAIGAIRWDAWLPRPDYIGAQVADTLGPLKYRDRLPFFAIENGDDEDDADFSAYSQTIMDREIEYAAYAGIDYWAYCWYPISGTLDTARNYHVSSSIGDKVKMCAILGVGTFGEADREQLVSYFAEDFYMKVQGERPLLYFYNNTDALQTIIDIQQDCLEADIPMPYCVTMSTMIPGMDAVSRYTVSASDGQSFASLAASAESYWDTQKNAGNQVIPIITTGNDPRPRMDNPVSWASYDSNAWAQTATASEIAQHLKNGIEWTNDNASNTYANAVIMYAWNEFDEGGWLCPTKTGGTERLDAIRSMLNNMPDTSNLLTNGGFENGTTGWTAGSGSITTDASNGKLGTNACLISSRTAVWGSCIQDIKSVLQANGTGAYSCNAWVKFASASDTMKIVVKINDSVGNHYFTGTNTSVNTAYTQLKGTLNLTWTGTLNTATIYIQSTSSTEDIYLDDFTLKKVPGNILCNAGFENGTDSWTASGCTISADASNYYTGTNSCAISDRTDNTSAATQDITAAMNFYGQESYTGSVWFKLASGTDTAYIVIKTNDDAGDHTFSSTAVSVGTTYTQLSGTFVITWIGELYAASITVYTGSSSGDIYMDDLTFKRANLLDNGGFEDSLAPWTAQSSTISLDIANAHTGSSACLISSRAAYYSSAKQDISSTLTYYGQGSYAVSGWVKFASGSDTAYIVVKTNDATGNHWFTAGSTTVGTTYAQLSGSVNITWTGVLNSAIIYVQNVNTGNTTDMYMDDFSLSK